MISYTVTACNEEKELLILLDTLSNYITDDDELVIQLDSEKLTTEIKDVVDQYLETIKNMVVIEFPLDNDFSRFKNNLKKYCSKKWIFNIDADEVPSQSGTPQSGLARRDGARDCVLTPPVDAPG